MIYMLTVESYMSQFLLKLHLSIIDLNKTPSGSSREILLDK